MVFDRKHSFKQCMIQYGFSTFFFIIITCLGSTTMYGFSQGSCHLPLLKNMWVGGKATKFLFGEVTVYSCLTPSDWTKTVTRINQIKNKGINYLPNMTRIPTVNCRICQRCKSINFRNIYRKIFVITFASFEMQEYYWVIQTTRYGIGPLFSLMLQNSLIHAILVR